MEPWIMRILVLGGGVLALGFVVYLVTTILRESEGNEKMKEISLAIRQGAMAFLRREFITLAVFTVIVFIVLALFIAPKPYVAIAYVCGTFTSALAGWLGMNIATKANARTANAAISSWAENCLLQRRRDGLLRRWSGTSGIIYHSLYLARQSCVAGLCLRCLVSCLIPEGWRRYLYQECRCRC